MEAFSSLLKVIEDIWSASGSEIWLKIILTILGIIGAGFGIYLKQVARKKNAEAEQNRNRQQDQQNNDQIEDQNQQDGQSVRDRLRRK